MAAPTSSISVLSVQSHVTRGYVGNKAAVFVLQAFGVDVDPIHVVEFSNHTGYKVFRGRRVTTKEIEAIVEGLRANNFLSDYRAVLTGYIGDADTVAYLSAVVKEIRSLRLQHDERQEEAQRRFLFVCDPVLGDNGKLYVSPSVVDAYRTDLLHGADVATPNGFEASVLSGITVDSLQAAQEAAVWFHQTAGVTYVVVKSFELSRIDEHDEKGEQRQRWIYFLTSERHEEEKEKGRVTYVQHVGRVSRIEGYFSGTGDVFAAILTARMLQQTVLKAHAFHDCVAEAMGSMQVLLKNTAQFGEYQTKHEAETEGEQGKHIPTSKPEFVELRLVQSVAAILGESNAVALTRVVPLPCVE